MAQAPIPTPAPAASAAQVTLDFGDAFAQALKGDDASPEPKKEEDPPAGDTPAAGTEGGAAAEGDQKTVDDLAAAAAAANGEGGEPGGEGGAPAEGGEGQQAAPAAPADGKQAAAALPVDGDGFTRLADLLSERLKPEPAKPAEPAGTPKVPTMEDFYTDEEKQLIAAYDKEWPDVARVEQIKRKGEYNMLVTHVFDQFVKEMRPVMDLVTQLAARQQYHDLKTLEPDYDELSEKVGDWIDGMPDGVLKRAYTTAITQGSAEDMQQLFDAYRKATGATAPAPQAGKSAAPVAPKPATELPAQTKQAVAALAPVSTKRSAQPEVTPDTFEDAFALFAKAKD